VSKIINFNDASAQGRELEYISEAITNGQMAGDEVFSRKCENLLRDALGCPRALITTSCTHALELAALLLDLAPGDEVIVPSFTFVSTANAFVLRGARPVFCDIRPDTLNLDETKLEALITPRTKAIVPVHYAGVGCEMDAIIQIANRHKIAVIEDNAHGLFGKYKGRWLGTFGQMATQSFHQTKNITCGEGGALLVNDPRFEERAEIIREKGTDRTRFFRGQVDKYSWVDVGSSYVMSDVLAAFLFGQLEEWQNIQKKRKVIWERYHKALAKWATDNEVRTPIVPDHCEQSYHMYYLLMPSFESRRELIKKLHKRGITAVFHYLPLHLSSFSQRMRYGAWNTERKCECPVTEFVSEKLVRLPFFTSLSSADQSRVINEIIN
jgi:dTDP-4-amino-4,6-dideoxygalactose transaminase